jgi:UDPglucose 6-dehydrogenase
MSIESAELCKISLNSFVTTKISFMNMLGEVVEQIPGANIDQITTALGHDKRIGPYFSKCGLGFGGPCFPRDNVAFAAMAEKLKVDAPFAKATDDYNRSLVTKIVNKICKQLPPTSMVGFLGIAFKPGTHVVEESPTINVIKALLKKGYQIQVFDSAGYDLAKKELGDTVTWCASAKECVENSQLVFVSFNDQKFKELSAWLKSSGKVLFDPWRLFFDLETTLKGRYITIGIGPALN